MPVRVVALLLALVLLWSGLSTIEAPRLIVQHSPGQGEVVAYAGSGAGELKGSVEHHHLDDLPSPSLIEPSTETPGLLLALSTPGAHSAEMAQPHAFTLVEAGSPFLAGPLRPPCSAVLAT